MHLRRRAVAALQAALALALGAAACGGGDRAAGAQGRAGGRDPAREAAPREVRVVEAAARPLPQVVPVTGTLAADERVDLAFKVAGRLGEIMVDLGTPVRRGQVVARLDPTDLRLRVRQAEAALRQSRARLGLPVEGSEDRVDPE